MLCGGKKRVRTPAPEDAGELARLYAGLRACYVRCHTVILACQAYACSLPIVQNHLIELLPRAARLRLLAICEPVELVMAEVLGEVGIPTRYVYFPTKSFISLVTPIKGKPVLEVGMIGREGMLGTHLALGVKTAPLHALVQGPGAAWRIGVVAFRSELAHSSALQRSLNRYVYVMMMQLASAASCLRFHQIEPRLARWLLMTQDRAQSNTFHITHEFLAYMLGVRRVGVTAAASVLQHAGLIKYHRGEIEVLSRRGLEAAACSCYAADRKAYADILH
jgi:CRP-like cAMP-binding protein